MTLFKRHIIPVVLLSYLVQPVLAWALVVGQIDTFEDGTTQGWVINLLGIGSPPPAALPTNISTGGPGGAGDNYLQLTALGGLGAGGKLTVINATQWAGSYIGAGIGFVRMDVNNLGTNDVALRLWFEDPTVGPPSNVAVSTNAISVLAGSGWRSVTFPIQPGDLTAITGSVTAALTNATDVRIFHSSSVAIPGPPIAAVLGVDNIEALAAPTPTPTDTPTESPTPVPTDTPTASPSSTPTITPTASSTATVTSTASPTLSGTPTETATPTPFPAPAITAGEAGSSVVTGRGVVNPNPGNNCITIFDCGTDGICNGMGDDTPIGTGSIDPFGAFAVQVAPPLEAGQRIFARDTCNGLNGPPFVVVTAAAPALSGSMVIALVAILGTVGLGGLRRLPLGQ